MTKINRRDESGEPRIPKPNVQKPNALKAKKATGDYVDRTKDIERLRQRVDKAKEALIGHYQMGAREVVKKESDQEEKKIDRAAKISPRNKRR